MIRSMTGYARVEASFAWGRLSWELRSVNHRYFDVSFKVPEEFRVLEGELRQAAGGTISRGKVECGLRYARENSGSDSIALDRLRLAQIKDALDAVAAELGASSVPEPMRVLAYPGVVKEVQADFAPLLAAARKLFTAALADFSAAREREGERLLQFIVEIGRAHV